MDETPESPAEHDATADQPLEESVARTLLPTPSTPGYTTYTDYYGRKWTCCTCVAAWLPWYEKLLKKRGLIGTCLDVWQLTGGAAASGGTHSQGGAIDLLYQTSDGCIAAAREMGATGGWRRTLAQGFSKVHAHLVLRGCAHNDPAEYQLTAQKRGYNGLGVGAAGTTYAGMAGYGGKDYHPSPSVYRTWSEGIDLAKKETAPVVQASTSVTIKLSRKQIHPGEALTVSATAAPAVAGVLHFEWSYPGSETWNRFGNKATSDGTQSVSSTPGADVRYRAVFAPTDTVKYKGSTSTPAPVVVDDAVKLRAQLAALDARIDALETKATP